MVSVMRWWMVSGERWSVLSRMLFDSRTSHDDESVVRTDRRKSVKKCEKVKNAVFATNLVPFSTAVNRGEPNCGTYRQVAKYFWQLRTRNPM